MSIGIGKDVFVVTNKPAKYSAIFSQRSMTTRRVNSIMTLRTPSASLPLVVVLVSYRSKSCFLSSSSNVLGQRYNKVQNWAKAGSGSGTVTILLKLVFRVKFQCSERTDCACTLSDPASFNPKQGHEFFFIVAVKFSGSPEFTLELILVSEVDQFVESNVKAHIIIAAWRASPTLLVMQESFVDSPHSRESIIGIGHPVCQKRTDGANHG